jgi:hypothetical protein
MFESIADVQSHVNILFLQSPWVLIPDRCDSANKGQLEHAKEALA